MTSLALPAVSAGTGLAGYLKAVQSFPMISREEEAECARRWHAHGDRDAAHRLVTSHLRLVVKIARQYSSYPVPLPDLISEGTVGLMKAVRKFDPAKGARLATYAMLWIKAEITDFILSTWSMVRVSSTQKRLYARLQRLRSKLGIVDGRELGDEHVADIADEMGIPSHQVLQLAGRAEQRDLSLDRPASGEENEGESFVALLEDDGPNPEARAIEADVQRYRRRIIADAMADLRERERDIFAARWLRETPLKLQELADRYGISRERVRQIEAGALKKVKARIAGEHAGAAALLTG